MAVMPSGAAQEFQCSLANDFHYQTSDVFTDNNLKEDMGRISF